MKKPGKGKVRIAKTKSVAKSIASMSSPKVKSPGPIANLGKWAFKKGAKKP
jgi:hypothetical protein